MTYDDKLEEFFKKKGLSKDTPIDDFTIKEAFDLISEFIQTLKKPKREFVSGGIVNDIEGDEVIIPKNKINPPIGTYFKFF